MVLSRRIAQLPDLVTPFRGPDAKALIRIMRNGKVNKHHKVEYMGALRNKDVLLCPLCALGFATSSRARIRRSSRP